MHARKRIAIFDYEVAETSPSGSCHLRLLEQLRNEFDFTVFSTSFNNPDPARIRWVRIPAIKRPLAALYGSYYLTSSVAHALSRRRNGSYDLVQAVEGYTRSCDITYVHFCHACYLRRYSSESHASGIRGVLRRLDHGVRALGEERALASPRLIVVPAEGLKDELEREHAVDDKRVRIIPNPVIGARFEKPSDFNRSAKRGELGASPDDLLAVFVALGHFERKGLPQLLEGMLSARPGIRLVVVGGTKDLVASYRARVRKMGLEDRVKLVGVHDDVRPYLWAADFFVFPSSYEVFPLALLQAAAAGLPLIVTPASAAPLSFRDDVHGFAIRRDPSDIARTLNRSAQLNLADRARFATNARNAAQTFDVTSFASAWRDLYRERLAQVRLPP